mgnify:CR=1 FL=1
MENAGKQLKNKAQEIDDEILETFEQLVAAIMTLETLSLYPRESPEENIISISSSNSNLIFLNSAVWNNPQAMSPFLAKANDAKIVVMCVCTELELPTLAQQYKNQSVHCIALPLSTARLSLEIENIFKLQSNVIHALDNYKSIKKVTDSVKYVLRISRELNGIRDPDKLLTIILNKAREITRADAGSIYVVKWDEEYNANNAPTGTITFKITQNESVTQTLKEFHIPISEGSVVGSSVVHETSINIPDLYKLDPDPEKNEYHAKHDRTWDEKIGYQCRSMLTLPMFDISHKVIGVIQLINRKREDTSTLKKQSDFNDYVIPFGETDIELAEIVAQQAGIALENAMLTEEKEALFEGFVHASVTAIEQRDPTTSGHSHRVASLSKGLAEFVNRTPTGPYGVLSFNDDQLKELEYASLLHDFGKLGVSENVLTKAKKLYPLELELLLERFEHVRGRYEIDYLYDLVKFLENPTSYPPGFNREDLSKSFDRRASELDDFLSFILKSNEPTVLEQGSFEKLKDIANISYRSRDNNVHPLLKDSELTALSVSRGSLTREEFIEIQSHVNHTYEFLRKIPWGEKFGNLPQIAAKHHEKLDGSGYPTHCAGEEIPVQSRIMTIADIFDALTAADRPYKKAVPYKKALDIIEMEVKSGKCDKDLFKIFIESKVYQSVLDKKQS